MPRLLFSLLAAGFAALMVVASTLAEPIRVGTFDVDASPPVGSPMAYDPTKEVLIPLSCRGVVILGDEQPIVLCAVDWIGIGNEAHLRFREELAEAVGTTADRVAVHTLHQHDAPRCDFSIDRLLAQYGINQHFFDSPFCRDVLRRAAAAAAGAKRNARPVTHIGTGEAIVEKVASNRRILGPDGKVEYVRWTATKDPAIREKPAGTVDPKLRMISFWNDDEPLVVLTYFATHPQSYYRTGQANPDFPGIARNARQKATGVPHVHFNGAGGNVGAGKWNDGSPENRQVLADRMARGMEHAWEATTRISINSNELGWKTLDVQLPAAPHLNEEDRMRVLRDESASLIDRCAAANDLVWLRRCQAGDKVTLGCLSLGHARILHMPGELFVEYQLAAQKMQPELFVAMAAYGDYAPGYIGTEIAYSQGGYETEPRSSLVAPWVEHVLMEAMETLLK